jgi:hypothetical protein
VSPSFLLHASIAVIFAGVTIGCTALRPQIGKPIWEDGPQFVEIRNQGGRLASSRTGAFAGKRGSRLGYDGDVVHLRNGDVLDIDMSLYDPKRDVIVTEVDAAGSEVTMTLRNRRSVSITFTHKCQVFTIGNTSALPPIEFAKGLPIEQVVITPLCDRVNSIIGYEVRYGSSSSGCAKEAREGLDKYDLCKDLPVVHQISDPCRYFGVGCKEMR